MQNFVTVVKVMQLCNFSGWTVWYMNYISRNCYLKAVKPLKIITPWNILTGLGSLLSHTNSYDHTGLLHRGTWLETEWYILKKALGKERRKYRLNPGLGTNYLCKKVSLGPSILISVASYDKNSWLNQLRKIFLVLCTNLNLMSS